MGKKKAGVDLVTDVAKAVKGVMDRAKANDILAKIDTPEKAVALTGDARAEYLKALEAVHGPTDARAAGMGFNLDTLYHGSPSPNIESFNPTLANSARKTGVPEGTIVLTDNPRTASSYANERTTMTGKADYGDAGTVYPVVLNPGKQKKFTARGDNWNDIYDSKTKDVYTTNDLFQMGKDSGKDSVAIKKVKDFGAGLGRDAVPATSVGVFDPKNIRSKFAAFDPRFKDSPLLMAGAAGAAMSMLPAESQAAAAVEAFNPASLVQQGMNAWQTNVVDPVANALKSTLTPDINVRGQQYQTASPVSNFAIDVAADPLNYVSGPAELGVTAAQAVSGFAHGGLVPEPVQIYSPDRQLGSIDPDELEAALAAGYMLPQGAQIPVFDPNGVKGTVAAEEYQAALASGFKPVTKSAVFGTPGQQLQTAVESAASSATFGLSEGLLNVASTLAPETFPTKEERLARREENPMASLGGAVTGMLVPGAAGAQAAKLGQAVATSANLGRVGTYATKAAIENAVFATGDEVAKAFLSDPKQTFSNAVANVGLSTLIGGGIGATMGGAGQLWSAGPGKKLTELLDGVKQRASGTPREALHLLELDLPDEMVAALSDDPRARELFQGLMHANTQAGGKVQQVAEELSTKLDEALNTTLGKTADEVVEVSSAKAGKEIRDSLVKTIKETVEPITAQYDKLESKFAASVIPLETRQAMINRITQTIADDGLLKAADDAPAALAEKVLKKLNSQATAQDLRLFAQNLAETNPFGKETYNIAKKLRNIINEAQEQTLLSAADGAGAETAALFRQTQAQYKQFRGMLDDINDYLHAGKPRGAESYSRLIGNMDPEDIANRLVKEKTGLREVMEQYFPEAAAAAKRYKVDSLLDSARTGDKIDIKKLVRKIEALEPETKQYLFDEATLKRIYSIAEVKAKIPKNGNPSGTARMLDKLWSEMTPTAGGIAGGLMGGLGGGVLGAIAALVGKEASSGAKLAMLRFLGSEAPTNAAAFKAAVGLGQAAAKGERKLQMAVRAVFKNSKLDLDDPKTEQLKKLIEETAADPDSIINFLDKQENVGYYNPEIAQELGQAAVRTIRYLSSIRPSSAPLSPLDAPRKVADYEEQDFNRALAIAEQPMLILDAVKRGTITMKDLQHIENTAPEFAQRMRGMLQQEMIEALADGETVPYATVIGLSTFLGQPLESSLQPQAIMSNQIQPVNMDMAKPPRKSNSLPKLPTSYQTPGQARQRSRAE